MGALAAVLPSISWPTVALALVAVAIIVFWPKRWSRVPGSIVAVAAGMLIVQFYHRLGWATDTIGSKFGGIPQGLPSFHFPGLDLDHLSGLIRPAFTIALLGAIESLLSAVRADRLVGRRPHSNQDALAVAAAHVLPPPFCALPPTGGVARNPTY